MLAEKRNTYFWFGMQYLQDFASTTGSLFLSVFIWQKTGGVEFLYKYYLALFVFIPVFGFVGAMLSQKLSARLSFILSFALNIFVLVFASVNSEFFLDYPLIFGAINGASIGLYAIPSNITMQQFFSKDLSGVSAKLISLSSINSLIIPLAGSLWVFLTGYGGLFIVGAVVLSVAILLLFAIDLPLGNKEWNWSKTLELFKLKDFRLFSFLWFMAGLKNGLEWSVFGVVLLKLMSGQIAEWGIMNFIAAFVGILSGMFYSKSVAGKKDKFVLLVSSILFTALGIFLVSDYNLLSYSVFFLGTRAIQTFISSSTSSLIGEVYVESKSITDSPYEFYSVQEIPLAIGRFIPLFLLFVSRSNLDENAVLVGIFLLISTVPLASTFVLQKMGSFSSKLEKEIQ